MSTALTSSVRTPDGISLGYTLRGDPGAERRIVLVHSLALDRDVWDRAGALLAERARVLTYDCRGHGASDKPAGPYALQSFAADLAALLDGVGWADAHVAGCSMGGNVSLAFAQTYPQRVRSLGLIDTTAWYGPQARQSWDERARKGLSDGLASMVEFQLTRWFGDAFRATDPAALDRFRAIFVANDPQAYAATCRMLGDFDLRERLGALTMPAAIVVGEEDYATPLAMAQQLHESIAGATLDVLPRARHLTPVESPEKIASILEQLHARTADQ